MILQAYWRSNNLKLKTYWNFNKPFVVEVLGSKPDRIHLTRVTSLKNKTYKVTAKNEGYKSQRPASTFYNRVEVFLIAQLLSRLSQISLRYLLRYNQKSNSVLTARSKRQKYFCKSWRQFPKVNVHHHSQQIESRLRTSSSGTTQGRIPKRTLF